MRMNTLGHSDIAVSRIGLGCMGMSEFYGPSDDLDSLAVMERALALGVNFFDTADMYGHGHNEELLGRFLKGRRDGVVVATKFGIVRPRAGVYARSVDNRPEYVRRACEASLARLGVDAIDLYYAHRLNPEHDLEAMMGELARLVAEGKVRAVGLSEPSEAQLRAAHAAHPVSAVQSEYSLWTRDIEGNGVLTACRELGISLVPYSPLGRGVLTGTIAKPDDLDETDFRRAMPRMAGDNLEANLVLVNTIAELAQAKGCTSAQLALAWVTAQGDDVFPIPGTRRVKYIEDNVLALNVVLSDEDLATLERVFTPEAVHGERYPEEGMKGLPR